MRFNSYEFIFAFLPAVWLGWRLALRLGGLQVGAAWLTLASLFFYAWWDWRYAPLLVASLCVNYAVGRRLVAAGAPGGRRWLGFGLAWNLSLLGYFKYWNFFVGNLNGLLPAGLPLAHVALPLGISFFTFQKIAFLVDAWRGKVASVKFGEFSLFVMFFPQLIAGPIVHHSEFIPQLRERHLLTLDGRRFALGLTVFSAGLFQKCFVADTLAPMADSAFGLAATGTALRLQEAWGGLMAYTLQLFYDFAGYSHMALGLALVFGLRLPVNFLAPYTASSMIEFWRRWHITLSAFLRDYVYIPLGGNQRPTRRHLLNLVITMLLGGLWHGAGWTFLLWGVWHGAALCVNHLWRWWRPAPPSDALTSPWWAHGLTLLTVVLGWVLFRAPDLAAARSYAASLVGLNGLSVPVTWMSWVGPLAPVVCPRGLWPNIPVTPSMLILLAAAGFLACRGPWLLRSLGVTSADVTPGPAWQETGLAPVGIPLRWPQAAMAGAMLALAVASLAHSSPFLYFQF